MSHFYGKIEGSYKPKTARGHKKDGMYVEFGGWNLKISAKCS